MVRYTYNYCLVFECGRTLHVFSISYRHDSHSLGECIDKVSITYDSDKVITICGSQVDAEKFNYRKDRLSSLPLTITFESSQCCHNCGFHIWVSCVPDPIISGSRLSPLTQGYRVCPFVDKAVIYSYL